MFKLHFLFSGISADPAYDGAPGEKGREGKEGPKGAQPTLNHFIDLQIKSKHPNILTVKVWPLYEDRAHVYN